MDILAGVIAEARINGIDVGFTSEWPKATGESGKIVRIVAFTSDVSEILYNKPFRDTQQPKSRANNYPICSIEPR